MRHEGIGESDFAGGKKAFLRADMHEIFAFAHENEFHAIVKMRERGRIIGRRNIVAGEIEMPAHIGGFFVNFDIVPRVHHKTILLKVTILLYTLPQQK